MILKLACYIDFNRSEFGYERRPLEQLESK